MATTFKLFYLGIAPDIDLTEGNITSENHKALETMVFGSSSDPIATHLQTLSPVGTSYKGGNATAYDVNNTESFTLDGGAAQVHDSTMIYLGTDIKYTDGTSVKVDAQVMQDTAGNLYLIPPTTGPNAYSNALTAKPIQQVTLGTANPANGTDVYGMNADRFVMTLKDYIVEGTAGNDVINNSYAGDPEGDKIDNTDGIDGSNNDTIMAGAGNDSIVANLGNDVIYAGTGDDTAFGGAGDDWASMGDGNDSFGTFGADSAGNDTIYGDAGDDYLIGGGGNDVIYGGADNDTMSGGIGSDTLYGGDGSDVFMVTEDHQGDTIFGGEGGSDNDVIDFANYLTTEGVNVTATGDEAGTYAYTGTSTGTTGVYSEIEGFSGTNYNDNINLGASGSGDTVWGNAGNDTLIGGSGADSLYGGTGNDVVSGGAGDDVIAGGLGVDDLSGGAGNDVIHGGVNAPIGTTFITNGTFTGGGAGWTGVDTEFNPESSYITGGPAGNGVTEIDGQAGKTTVLQQNFVVEGPQTANLTFSSIMRTAGTLGVDGFKVEVLNSAGTVISTTTVLPSSKTVWANQTVSLNFPGADTYTLRFTEVGNNDAFGAVVDNVQITATSAVNDASNDTLRGDAGDDSLYGGGGNDVLYGGDGNDSVQGDAGNDTLHGGAGADLLLGGNDADVIYGGAGDTVQGGEGGTDNDTLLVNFNDVLSINYGGGNNEAGTITFTAASGGGTLTFSEIEHVGFAGVVDGTAANDIMNPGYTDSLGDQIDGADGDNDMIFGYGGNDSIRAGNGDDTVYGGTGDDTIAGQGGANLIYGEDGNDLIDGAGSVGNGNDTIYGGTGNDSVYGGDGNDLIDLGDGDDVSGTYGLDSVGDDTIYGGAGNDQIIAGAGNDSVTGGTGNDTIDGAEGNDIVYGGAGNDVIYDATGNDVMYGGDDADTFRPWTGLGADWGSNTIVGGEGGLDQDVFDASQLTTNTTVTFTGNEAGTLASGLGNATFSEIEQLQLGSGNDTVDASATTNGVHITADAGNDRIIGGAGADSIYGGDGADVIYGSAGDSIVGGEGGTDNDTLVLNFDDVQSINYGGGNNEAGTVTFTAASGGGTLTFSQIENIRYAGRVDGTAGNDTMNIGYTDLNGDQIDGTDGVNDAIYGYGGDDTINAGAGNDLVYGGTGNDVLRATAGNDTLYGDEGNDDLQAGSGNDIMYGGDGSDLFHTALDSSTDTVIGGETGETIVGDVLDIDSGTTASVVTFTGNEAGTVSAGPSNVIFSEIETIWTDSGNDTIDASVTTDGTRIWAGAGNDFVIGGSGADNLLGQDGDDEIFANAGNDSVYGGAGNDQIYGGDGDDRLWGDAGNDYMQGDDGNDVVEGGLGDDFIRGDAGNDLVYGGAGNDTVYGGAGNDQVYGGDGDDEIYGGYGDDTVYGGAGNDTITGSGENDIVYGDDGDDYMQGSYGDDTMYGGAGNDTMLGEDDADTFYGGVGDYVDGYENVTTGTDNDTLHVTGIDHITWDVLNTENGVVHYAGGGTLQFFNIERVFVDGVQIFPPNFVVSGTTGDDVIDFTYLSDPEGDIVDNMDNQAGNNDDRIEAGAGNDHVAAGFGNDTVYGGTGNDDLYGESGNDLIFGEDGNDLISGGNDDDTLDGGNGNDTLYGDDGNDSLLGGAGNDTLYGGAGDDTVDGMTGDDTVYGDEGNDLLYGGDGNDIVYGGVGNDTIDGGAGDDSVQGYLGDDLIAGGAGNDTIDGGDGNDAIFGGDGNDFLQGGDGDDSLHGGTGDDTIWAGDGNDTLNGGAGNDIMGGGDGDDRFVLTDGFGTDDIDGAATGETIGDTLDLTGLTGNVTVDLTAYDPEAGSVTSGTDSATFREIENIELGDATETLVLADGSGADVVSGFTIPTDLGGGVFSGMDQLDVSGMTDANGNPVNVNDVTVSDDGNGNAVLTFPNGESLTLIGVDPADVTDHAVLEAMGIPAETLDFVVEGTGGDDFIDSSYTGDPEGDMIDAADNLAGNNDDLVTAGAGNDTVLSGEGNDTVYGEDGNDMLQSGNGDDVLYGGAGNDTFYSENGSDTVYGGAGNDSVYASMDGDLVYGGDGDDYLQGGGYATTGHDTIHGDAGNDTLTGGLGNDQLYGGADNDTLQVIGSVENDTLVGGETGSDFDTVDLSMVGAGVNVSFAGNEAGSFNTGGTESGQFSEIENFVLTDYADLYSASTTTTGNEAHGGGGNDTMLGGTGNDTLFGDDGDDSLFAGAGDDSIDGGTGNDTIYADAGNDTVSGGAGDDTLALLSGDNLGFGDAGNDLIIAGDGNDTLYGGSGSDTIFGGAGDDLIEGGDGNDTLNAGDGDDTVYGGAGADTFVVQSPMGTNTIFGGETGYDEDTLDLLNFTGSGVTMVFTGDEAGVVTDGAGTTTFSEIENFNLTMQDDLVDASADTTGLSLFGNGGNDTITGGSGNDLISGGDGDDVIRVQDGFGVDSVNGGETDETFGDTLDLSAVTGPLTINLAATNPEDGLVSNGTDQISYANIEHIILGAGVDTLVLANGSGDDAVQGFTTPTALGGGGYAGVDQIDVSGLVDAGGDPVNVGDVTVTDDGNGNAVLNFPNGESLTLIGVSPSAVNDPAILQAMGIPGLSNDGIIQGTSGDDVIGHGYVDVDGDKVDGNDAILPGQTGNDDIIQAGAGNDIVESGGGNDEVYGGTGNDQILGESGDDSLFGDEGDDTLLGGYGDDQLSGGTGNDSLDGGAGNDLMFGGLGDDWLNGGTGNDTIYADDGDDTLYGGWGDDALDGAEGDDQLFGGLGNDTLDGEDGNDLLSAGEGDDVLAGGVGNDTLYGGLGADTMYGNDDRDTFVIGLDEGDGDVVDGGTGGDDYDVLDLTAYGHPATNIIYDPMDPKAGTVEFLDSDGLVVGTMTFTNIEHVMACFTPGAMVLTEFGDIAVEDLQPGDRVLTRDNGYQTIRWTGRRDLSHAELVVEPRFNPVFIAKGALGANLPERDMMVSPQHRMLMTGAKAEMLFGEHEVLVAAKHLVGLPGIEQRVSKAISYIHILFDQHEIVRADGAWSESFQPGDQTLDGLARDQRDEILALFPELARGVDVFPAARLTLKAREARVLMAC